MQYFLVTDEQANTRRLKFIWYCYMGCYKSCNAYDNHDYSLSYLLPEGKEVNCVVLIYRLSSQIPLQLSDCATSLFVSSFDVACTHLQQLPPGTGHLDHAAGDGDGDGDGYLAKS